MFWWFQLRAISQLTGTAAAPTMRLKERRKEEEENAIGSNFRLIVLVTLSKRCGNGVLETV